jgi:O-antigen/teichoic acid export membrane protein
MADFLSTCFVSKKQENKAETKHAVKNSLMLYFRHILILLVSLYTVRIILKTLGTEDYGIYNIVVGIVNMFSFLSNSMAGASQRYFSFELGRNNFEQLKRLFCFNIMIYLLIAIIIIILAETIGLWFVMNKLIIPLERKNAALWVYQLAILSFLFTILTTPYMAIIIAHEDMDIYTYISIIEVILKLGTVILLQIITFDRLKLYGILICTVTVINTSLYRLISIKKYRECKFWFHWNKKLIREILGYTGWNLFGSLTYVFRNHAINILLNRFFNPSVIAARSIAATVNTAVAAFFQNFNMALRPKIIKTFSSGQRNEMFILVFRGAKYSYFLMFLFTLPLVLGTPTFMTFWIQKPPEYTVLFVRLVLIDVLLDSVGYPIESMVNATGKIKMYHLSVSGIILLNLPVSWVALLFGLPPYSVSIVAIVITIISSAIRLLVVKKLIDFKVMEFMREVLLPILSVSIASSIIPLFIIKTMDYSFTRFCLIILICIASIIINIYFFGLNRMERNTLLNILQKIQVCINSKEQNMHKIGLKIKSFIKSIRIKFYLLFLPRQYKKTKKRLSKKEKIQIAFFVYTSSIWKLDKLYWLMEESKIFEPTVVICPVISYHKKYMYELMNQVEKFCIKKDYRYINTIDDIRKNRWKDIKQILKPDIIFYTNSFLTIKKYRVSNYFNCSLPCYASYGPSILALEEKEFNSIFHNIIWKGFYETEIHQNIAVKNAYNKGKNIEVVGLPLFDEFDKLKTDYKDIWKIKDTSVKRIIWAPHYTIGDIGFSSSCFLEYAFFMLDIAKKNKGKIQIAFKPHQGLKSRLYSHSEWGIDKTEKYYEQWNNIENGQIETGEYGALFIGSDAMIHDSISFISEYMYTNRPILFTIRDKNVKFSLNDYGGIIFKKMYISSSFEETVAFIDNIVIKQQDYLQHERERFFKEYLCPSNKSASENILNCISREIFTEK